MIRLPGRLVAKNGGSPITVILTNANNQPIVFAGSGNWAALSGGAGFFTGANTNLTGNANFNTCLNDGYNDNATHTITLSNLVVGQQYQVQLFALDNRSGLTPDVSSRFANWQDPADATDTAETFAMTDNVYMLGTFTANSSAMTIQQNMLNVTPPGISTASCCGPWAGTRRLTSPEARRTLAVFWEPMCPFPPARRGCHDSCQSGDNLPVGGRSPRRALHEPR